MKNLIIGVIVLAVVGIGVYYFVFNNSGGNPAYTSTPTQTASPTATLSPSNSPTPTSSPARTATPTPKVSVSNTPTPTPANVTIQISNFSFNPQTVTVKKGTKVTWVNNDSVSHTVTSDSGSLLNSPTIAPGQSFSFTFTSVGTATYHCSIHTSMRGSITVTN